VHISFQSRERKTSIQSCHDLTNEGKDLKDYVMKFNCETVLIPDLYDEVAYTAFLNGLLSIQFKFYLIESKATTLVDVLKRVQDFAWATEIR